MYWYLIADWHKQSSLSFGIVFETGDQLINGFGIIFLIDKNVLIVSLILVSDSFS